MINSDDYDSKLLVLLPVYNSGLYLHGVLSSISSNTWDKVSNLLVLNNASTDNSVQIVQEFAKIHPNLSNKILIQTHKTNLGYGGSIIWGLNWALEHFAQHVMILHSDDQADWGLISKNFVDNLSIDKITVSSRLHPEASMKGYNLKRNLGNRFFKVVTFLATGIRMSDPGSAIVCFPVSAISGINFQKFNNGYLFHPQLNILFYSNKKFEVLEVPLDWRDASKDNNFRIIRYGMSLLFFLIKFWRYHRIVKLSPEKSIYRCGK